MFLHEKALEHPPQSPRLQCGIVTPWQSISEFGCWWPVDPLDPVLGEQFASFPGLSRMYLLLAHSSTSTYYYQGLGLRLQASNKLGSSSQSACILNDLGEWGASQTGLKWTWLQSCPLSTLCCCSSRDVTNARLQALQTAHCSSMT